jgi:hypothetical protein
MKTTVTTDSLGQLIKMLSIYIDRNGPFPEEVCLRIPPPCLRQAPQELQVPHYEAWCLLQARLWLQVGQGQEAFLLPPLQQQEVLSNITTPV